MELSFVHILFIFITIFFVIGCGILSSRRITSAEGFSLNGRKTSASMVAGAIAGSCIGGGATVGTSQMAFTLGLSAWWFTLGIGIGFIIMALFFAKPLRNSGQETISQILVQAYDKHSGPIASIIASLGIFFACVSSVLPAIYIVARLMNISIYISSAILMVLVCVYIFFGGMKGASVSGLLKTIILWAMLLVVGYIAYHKLDSFQNFNEVFSEPKWLDIFGQGVPHAIENVISLIAGVLCAQTYAQVIFSAKNVHAARIGSIAAALVSMPVGLPCIMAGMYMHANHPEIPPILALPEFIIENLPQTLAGITLGVVMVSLISSISGLTLGISTMFSRDLVSGVFNVKDSVKLLMANRIAIIVVTIIVILFSLYHQESQILTWNFLSMSLRGSIFIPLTIAIFKPKLLSPIWAIIAMIVSAFLAATSETLFHITIRPLFVAFIASSIVVIIGILVRRK